MRRWLPNQAKSPRQRHHHRYDFLRKIVHRASNIWIKGVCAHSKFRRCVLFTQSIVIVQKFVNLTKNRRRTPTPGTILNLQRYLRQLLQQGRAEPFLWSKGLCGLSRQLHLRRLGKLTISYIRMRYRLLQTTLNDSNVTKILHPVMVWMPFLHPYCIWWLMWSYASLIIMILHHAVQVWFRPISNHQYIFIQLI